MREKVRVAVGACHLDNVLLDDECDELTSALTAALGDDERADLLTDDEHTAMRLSADLANVVRRIIGSGSPAEHDWNEAAQRIHAIQHTIMAQAAARAYPALYRPLGGVIKEPHRWTVHPGVTEPDEAMAALPPAYEPRAFVEAPRSGRTTDGN